MEGNYLEKKHGNDVKSKKKNIQTTSVFNISKTYEKDHYFLPFKITSKYALNQFSI